jgi:transcriptional regulator with XRE-family HTH domain
MLLNVKYLQTLIEKKGWSERQFAMKCGLSSATVSRIISGKRGAGTRALVGIMKALPNEPLEKLFFLSS